jgi:plastocyanin
MFKTTALLLVAASLASLPLAACSSSSSTTGSTSGGGAAPSGEVNGCTEATATDMTADKTVTINFGGAIGLKYSPACVKVAKGTVVTWDGDFSVHPLVGGTVTGSGASAVASSDAASPITEAKASGMSASVTFADDGPFPFYCAVHFSDGMEGAIFVAD